ncbi:MAG: hypothetical protein ACREON_13750 [Gemmatimonadaceae bacterium]
MAEIKIQERRGGLGWLWALIALVVVVLLAWYFLAGDTNTAPGTTADTLRTGLVVPAAITSSAAHILPA